MATSKSIALAAEIKDVLAKRLSSLTITEGFDTAQNPTLLIGAAAAGSPGAFIRVKADWDDNAAQVDGIGLPQRVYTPHVIQIAVEGNYAGTNDNIADVNSWAVLLPIVAEVLARGCKTEMWVEANGTAPSVTTFATASKKKAEHRDLYFPLQNQI